jgi:hypothetical protein
MAAMHASPRRVSRPLRWVLLLICAGGAVLAADKTWWTDLPFEFKAADWWSNISAVEAPNADLAIAPGPANHRAAELSMGQLLHGLLFSKPSTGWRLEAENTNSTSAWLTQQSGGTFTSAQASDYLQPVTFSAGFVTGRMAPVPNDPTGGPTTTGNWISNASGMWGTSTNWQFGTVPQGNTAAARFDRLDITTDVTVTNETPRTIGIIQVGDTNGTNHYNITGSTLTFDNAFDGHGTLIQATGSAGDTISAPLLLNQDLTVENFSTKVFTLSGSITANATPPTSAVIQFTAGNVNVTGNMSDGSGTALGVRVDAGVVTLSGTNSYTRQTFVNNSAQLLVNGDNSAATGPVVVTGQGTLGGIGKIGGDVSMFGNSIITGATTTTVGTLTMLGNVFMVDGENGGGTYIANLSGSLSDLLAISGSLTLGTGSFLNINGSADGTTTYVLATFASHSDIFETVTGMPANYSLVYNSTDLELVPIPEPSTWIGAALALGAIGFVARRRLRAGSA